MIRDDQEPEIVNDEEAARFYADPEHHRPAGPWAYRRVRPGIRQLRYDPPGCGPQSQTVNAGSLPCWERNPAAGDPEEVAGG